LNGEIEQEQVYKGDKERDKHRYTRTEKQTEVFGKKTHCMEMSLHDDMTNLHTQ
jgi:hypothetical protein